MELIMKGMGIGKNYENGIGNKWGIESNYSKWLTSLLTLQDSDDISITCQISVLPSS